MTKIVLFILLSFFLMAQAPFPVVPTNAIPFDTSDSATFEPAPSQPPKVTIWPGSFRYAREPFGQNQFIEVWVVWAECGVMPIGKDAQGVNLDIHIAIIDLQTGWHGRLFNGMICNATASQGVYGSGNRAWRYPLSLTAITPSFGGPYVVGAVIDAWLSVPAVVQYQYAIQGAVR